MTTVARPLEALAELLEEFHREGSVLIPNVLTPDEVVALRTKTDEYAASVDKTSKHYTFAGDKAFVFKNHWNSPEA